MRHLLNDAKHEIVSLRRENEILRAKCEVMDLFACVLHATPADRSQGMSSDVAWALEKEITRIEEQEKPQVVPTGNNRIGMQRGIKWKI